MSTMRSSEWRGDLLSFIFIFYLPLLLHFLSDDDLCCRGKEDKDNVVLYFDSWPREELCVTLPLKQDTIINEVKPAVVSLYDYYNTDDKATVLYSLK